MYLADTTHVIIKYIIERKVDMLSKKSWRLLLLSRIPFLTRKQISTILAVDNELTQLFNWTESDWTEILMFENEKAKAIRERIESKKFRRNLYIETKQYPVTTMYENTYPSSLRNIPDPPLVLYYLGDPSLFQIQPTLSVVGTRYPSDEASTVMKKILTPIAKRKWCLVSGMARGVDSMAHELAIEEQSSTIAVLGSGFNHIYPQESSTLFQRMVKEHLVISEYPPHTKPQKFHFPERNRIISGLGFATLVIEAKHKSGTMITVDQALEQGKEVLAVPGSVLAKTSEGCHQLIKEGAKIVTSSDDILTEWQ